jgi:hypothetical protein
MPGGIMQLIFQGAQDLYLTGNPTMTFFKAVYKRYTQFGTEYITLPFDTIPNFTPTQMTKTSCKIGRNADLIYDTYLTYDLPAIFTNNQIPFGWVEELGTHIIQEISIRLDGFVLDTQRGDFMKIFTDLYFNGSKKSQWLKCVGGESFMLNTAQNLSNDITNQQIGINARRLYIPLLFWYCLNSGLSIPLVALQYNELYIDVTFSPLNELIRIGNPPVSPKRLFGDYQNSDFNINIRNYFLSLGFDQTNVFYYFTQNNWQSNTNIMCNYIFLGDDERQMFAQTSHEYLITQVQFNLYQGLSGGPNYLDTIFSHPIKEIFWVLTQDNLDLYNDWYNFTGLSQEDYQSFQYYQYMQKFYNYGHFNEPLLSYIKQTFTPFVNSVKAQSVSQVPPQLAQTYFGNFYSIMESAQPIFNNNDRMEIQDHDFYQNLQLFKYHSGLSQQGIYILSFSLNPEDYQPSGSQNFSRLDNQEFRINIFDTFSNEQKFNCYMYGINYNVFRIIGGMGSTVFSN